MCGICGFIDKEPKVEQREKVLAQMQEAIRHRGPDGSGQYLDEQAALGFQRLAIIDLETGMQPMKNETGSLVVVFNGEIYNYRELREELKAAGHVFATWSDTEVLLHGYEEWGQELPGRLRGMFAFLIWDKGCSEIFAARDYFGIKPFYYAIVGKSFVFGSEIKAILQYPGYQRELNQEALEQYLSFQYSVLEESFFKGIYRLEPGHWLKYRAGSIALELNCYFEPELQPPAKQGREKTGQCLRRRNKLEEASERDWISQIDKVLENSVQAHMEADVEIGTFLSGGVDSGLIAREFRGKRAYTVGFGEESSSYNEIAQARETAKQCHLQHQGRRIREQEFWDAIPRVMYHLDEPSGDASAVALYFLSREAARDVKVVVSGEGADELFGGYRIYCEPEALRRYQILPAGLRKKIAGLAKHLPEWKGKHFLMRGGRTLEERFIGNANIFSYEDRRELLEKPTRAESPRKLLEEDYERTKKWKDAERMQDVDLRHWLPGDILQKADRMSMAHSLEVRVPYLDRRVFETVRCLPSDLKQRKSVTKYALRKVAALRLDLGTSQRPKLGFPVPIRVWMRTESGQKRLREAFQKEAAQKYFRQEVLEKLLEEHKKGQRDNSRKLWTVYAFCVWYEVYFAEQ